MIEVMMDVLSLLGIITVGTFMAGICSMLFVIFNMCINNICKESKVK